MLVAHSNRIFYVFNFIIFDIGYEILVLSKVTKDFSSSNGSYVIAYAIISTAIFFLTALSLTKHYSRSNITVISGTVNFNRSISWVGFTCFEVFLIMFFSFSASDCASSISEVRASEFCEINYHLSNGTCLAYCYCIFLSPLLSL